MPRFLLSLKSTGSPLFDIHSAGSRVDCHYLIGDVIAVQQRETMLTAQHIQRDMEGITLGLNCRYLPFQPVRVKAP